MSPARAQGPCKHTHARDHKPAASSKAESTAEASGAAKAEQIAAQPAALSHEADKTSRVRFWAKAADGTDSAMSGGGRGFRGGCAPFTDGAAFLRSLEHSRRPCNRPPCKAREGQRAAAVMLFLLERLQHRAPESPDHIHTLYQEPRCLGALASTSYATRLGPSAALCTQSPGDRARGLAAGGARSGVHEPGKHSLPSERRELDPNLTSLNSPRAHV